MRRLFAPAALVAFVVALSGCGGGTTPSFDDGTGGDGSGGGGAGATLVPAGVYGAGLASTNSASGSFTGSGTASVATDGTVTVTYTSSASVDARVLVAKATTANAVVGSLRIGTGTPFDTEVTLTTVTGAYKLTSVYTLGGVTTTDVFTLTATRPAAGTYRGTLSGTDTQGATYTAFGTPSATVAANGALGLSFTDRRSGGLVQTHSLSSTLLADGTFSGAINFNGFNDVTASGTWTLGSGNVLTLRLTYVNPTISGSGGANPTVTQTLTLTRQ